MRDPRAHRSALLAPLVGCRCDDQSIEDARPASGIAHTTWFWEASPSARAARRIPPNDEDWRSSSILLRSGGQTDCAIFPRDARVPRSTKSAHGVRMSFRRWRRCSHARNSHAADRTGYQPRTGAPGIAAYRHHARPVPNPLGAAVGPATSGTRPQDEGWHVHPGGGAASAIRRTGLPSTMKGPRTAVCSNRSRSPRGC